MMQKGVHFYLSDWFAALSNMTITSLLPIKKKPCLIKWYIRS